jgi:hypothetical protein
MMNDLDEMAAVYKVAQVYFDALYYADAARMADVMLPAAVYATTAEGDLLHRTQPEYLAVLAKREPPADRQETRRDKVVSVQFAGRSTALVVANCAIGDRYFTDLLTLVQLRGRWWIIAKVFDFERLEEREA